MDLQIFVLFIYLWEMLCSITLDSELSKLSCVQRGNLSLDFLRKEDYESREQTSHSISLSGETFWIQITKAMPRAYSCKIIIQFAKWITAKEPTLQIILHYDTQSPISKCYE